MSTDRSAAQSELINVERVADLLGCTVRMVRKLASEKAIPIVKVGSLTRFRPADIESYIERRLVEGAVQ